MNPFKAIKPDIIINYTNTPDNIAPIAVVYVRPKTNQIKYEKELILGIQQFADIVYLANLNGKLFIKNALILEHYSTQYNFSIKGKNEISMYPEMIEKIESYFNKNFNEMKIIGAFDAILNLNIDADELFNIIVDEKDFLKLYGQTIKKIKDYYIVNYNIPAIIKKYIPTANVFVVAARLRDPNTNYKEIDQAIFELIKNDKATPIIDEDKLNKLKWNEKIRRTYHISHNHLTAIFDMLDFVFRTDGEHIELEEIPFANHLMSKKVITREQLLSIKDYSIMYIEENGKKRLANIMSEAYNKSYEECEELLKSIIWEK